MRADATANKARMNGAVQPGVSLQAIQFPVRAKLDDVSRAMATIVASKMPLVGQVSAHLLALRKAIEPWIGATEAEGPEKRKQRVDEHLSVLTHASARS